MKNVPPEAAANQAMGTPAAAAPGFLTTAAPHLLSAPSVVLPRPIREDLFWQSTMLDFSGCWLWTGAVDKDGYGRRKGYLAHRLAYTFSRGPIPAGLTLDHLCRVRRCVNPDHLEPIDHATNYKRAVAARTSCRNGHAYTPETVRVRHYSRGYSARQCLVCERAA